MQPRVNNSYSGSEACVLSTPSFGLKGSVLGEHCDSETGQTQQRTRSVEARRRERFEMVGLETEMAKGDSEN